MRLDIHNFGPIGNGTVEFGDLTVFIGQQATGKSLAAAIFKYCIDRLHFRKVIEQQNFRFGKDTKTNLELYFGEGGSLLWSSRTRIKWNEKVLAERDFTPKQGERVDKAEEKVFYVPAQRILAFANSWPRNFADFGADTAFCMRHFSESLRQDLEFEKKLKPGKDNIFPNERALKKEIRERFSREVYAGKPVVPDRTARKRFLLRLSENQHLPFLTWSAGQKEFLPLLLSFYRLCPSGGVARHASIEHVVLEEPEMGLHPAAITDVMLQILDLLARDYKVIITTHSQDFLYLVWFFQNLKQIPSTPKKKLNAIIRLFSTQNYPNLNKMFKAVIEKNSKSFLFHRNERENNLTTIKDISSLDAASPNQYEASWGGITDFGGRAIDILSEFTHEQGR